MSFGTFGFGEAPFGATSTALGGVGFASLPALTGDIAAAAIAGAVATATFPALTADVAAIAIVTAAITASLPALVAEGLGANIARAVVAASLPALRAEITITTGSRRTLRSWQLCPRPTSGFTPSGRIGTLRDGHED